MQSSSHSSHGVARSNLVPPKPKARNGIVIVLASFPAATQEAGIIHGSARSNAGLTLIETTTAFAIAIMGVFGAMQLHLRAMDTVRTLHQDNLAQQALMNELETLKATPFDQLTPTTARKFSSDTAFIEPLHLHETQTTIRAADTPGLVQVTATIIWRGEKGRRIERSLTTLLTNHGETK